LFSLTIALTLSKGCALKTRLDAFAPPTACLVWMASAPTIVALNMLWKLQSGLFRVAPRFATIFFSNPPHLEKGTQDTTQGIFPSNAQFEKLPFLIVCWTSAADVGGMFSKDCPFCVNMALFGR